MNLKKHKDFSFISVRMGVLSVSNTRSIDEDKSGKWIAKQIVFRGHDLLVHSMTKDKKSLIKEKIMDVINKYSLETLIITGGTGITKDDVTIETVATLFSKIMTGFSSLFVQLSYEKIGSSAIMSRAIAGIIGETSVFCIPGSIKACKLACNFIIFPELIHIVSHIK